MTYLVMARKYRPMGFEDVVAQQHVTTTLVNALNSGRIGHAYLFAGPRGTGKTTVARILAKALDCIKGPTSKPCNKCQFCEEVNIGRSLDVIEIDGASNNSVEDVRALRENVKYTPTSGKYKVYIIDEVHMLSDSAFNALLKTLEEPPKHVVFIFATTEPHQVPATVLSRCQRFDFRRIPIKDLIDSINTIAEKEKIEIEEEAGFILAHKADGSLRDILSLLDQVISYGGKKITADLVNQTLGLVDIPFLFEMEQAIRQKDSSKVLSLLEEFINAGGDLEEFVHGLIEHFRNLLIAKISPGRKEVFELSEEHIRKYEAQAKDLVVSDILRMIKISADLNSVLKRSNDPRTHVEVALVKLSRLDSSIRLEELLEGLISLKSGCNDVSGTSSPIKDSPIQSKTGNPSASSPRKTGDISFSQIQAKWDKILEKVKKNKTSLWSCLVEGELCSLEGDSIVLEFHNGRKFHKQQVEKKENSKLIGDIISETFGFPIKIKTMMDEAKSSPFKHQLAENRRSDKSDIDKTVQEPNIKEILDVLGGELLAGDEKPI